MRCSIFLLVLVCRLSLKAQFLPPGFPQMTIQKSQGESWCDNLFLATVRFVLPSQLPSTAMILDRNGDVAWYFQSTENVFDFRPQPGGYLSLFVEPSYYLIDSTLSFSGQVDCVGKPIDFHALHVTSDARIFALCTTDSTMDLSGLTTASGLPGSANGNVVAQTVQELSFNGNLIREWEPWPWFQLGDADSVFFTQPATYDFTHTNSIDFDGQNLLLSHRSLHALSVIDWNSGALTRHIGGVRSDYGLSVPAVFKGQHTARFLDSGRVSLYDNGAQNNPPLSRGLILSLDDSTQTGQVHQEYPNTALVSNSMGSFQVLPDGSALVNHGRFSPIPGPNVEYFAGNGALKASLTLESTYFTYAAHCGDLPFDLPRPEIRCETRSFDSLLLEVSQPSADYLWSTGATSSSIWVTSPGRYQVFVPSGVGVAGSWALEIVDVSAGCPIVGVDDPPNSVASRPKSLGKFDLMGRPTQAERGRWVLERMSDGSVSKVFVF